MHRLLLLLTPLILSGCAAPLLIGGAAATGVAVANDRRTAGTMLDDERIEMNVLSEVARDQQLVADTHLNVTSYNGIVLLSGEAKSPALAERISAIAGRVIKVREVKNELRIGFLSDSASRNRDTMLTSRVKSRLVAAENVDGTAFKVVSEQGTVYLMGLVTPTEAEAAVNVVRRTEGVLRIVQVVEYQH